MGIFLAIEVIVLPKISDLMSQDSVSDMRFLYRMVSVAFNFHRLTCSLYLRNQYFSWDCRVQYISSPERIFHQIILVPSGLSYGHLIARKCLLHYRHSPGKLPAPSLNDI